MSLNRANAESISLRASACAAEHQLLRFGKRVQSAFNRLRQLRLGLCLAFAPVDQAANDRENILESVAHFLSKCLLLRKCLRQLLFRLNCSQYDASVAR